eukprot:CAMPEP_0172552946 /NCGR_PEP_ID=MMETSP1067-20121228/47292_1 /TAXON_ID=265564 ORGANISM="Thalassiosira punctigera, Strain Tpunct2005C2" /NCGR_SAMPLE_ID=MMETSP1067 /ASSEMBLY_ACC=CAM_ASM_000444 /LENGTH=227 /DNA_ID=CAMNT_0013341023 /DNA_START=30 /DNA_END=713 /DNA_ORIENTATION=+
MKLFPLIATIVLYLSGGAVSGFSMSSSRSRSPKPILHPSVANNPEGVLPYESNPGTLRRRALLSNFIAASASALVLAPTSANADSSIPSVTSAEFDTILKDSAKSILSVELSGPKSETAMVKLVDGTTFTIGDLVESSTDPRSPLKLVARCRLYKIPVKNTGLVSALSGEGSVISASGRKKKNYMNPRVQEAERKEREKRERMAEDERERLEELYLMEGREEGFLKE